MSQASYHCSTALYLKLIFITYDKYLHILSAPTAFMPEYPFVRDTFNFKKLLLASGAYRKSVAVASVCLVGIFFCYYCHVDILSSAKLSLFSYKTKYLNEKMLLFYGK